MPDCAVPLHKLIFLSINSGHALEHIDVHLYIDHPINLK